ncbi:MAG: cbb3-type cytochrome oxidase subunit 3 [Candidatus Krumholzibacteriia bacterium]
MYQEFFAKSDHLIWPLLGLVIFVSIFLGVLAYVFLGLRDKSKIESVANLPLEDNEVITPRAEGSMS